MADARRDLCAVGFDFHAPAAAVALLATREVNINLFGQNGNARGHSFSDASESRAMRFSCSKKTKLRHKCYMNVGLRISLSGNRNFETWIDKRLRRIGSTPNAPQAFVYPSFKVPVP